MPRAQLLLLMEQTLHLYHRGAIGLGHIQSAVAASLGDLGTLTGMYKAGELLRPWFWPVAGWRVP